MPHLPSFNLIINNKSRDDRLISTAKYIADNNKNAGIKVYQWGKSASVHELSRISDRMHLAKKGSSDDRKKRRSIILIRSGIMRHELRKVITEVSLIKAAHLTVKFKTILTAQTSKAILLLFSSKLIFAIPPKLIQ